MIAIVDYGSGNIFAIANILKQLGSDFMVVRDYKLLGKAEKYILPGVGHFDQTMSAIERSSLTPALEENIRGRNKPVLGICVGMQIMADASDEGTKPGLGWIPGNVLKIGSSSSGTRLPHMGWNSITISDTHQGLLSEVDAATGFYFLHSYHFVPNDSGAVCATTHYGDSICCAISNGENVFGVQFHPEKSHRNGVMVFKNFIEM